MDILNIHPSIHPLSAAYPGPGHGGIRLSNVTQTSFSAATFVSSSGESRGVPRPREIYNPPSVFWDYPEDSSQSDVPGTPLNAGIQEVSMPEPSQLAPFNAEEQLYS